MAARKPLKTGAPQRPDLDRLIAAALEKGVTEEQLRVQRVSFVYGNAPFGSNVTKESASTAITRMKLVEHT